MLWKTTRRKGVLWCLADRSKVAGDDHCGGNCEKKIVQVKEDADKDDANGVGDLIQQTEREFASLNHNHSSSTNRDCASKDQNHGSV